MKTCKVGLFFDPKFQIKSKGKNIRSESKIKTGVLSLH